MEIWLLLGLGLFLVQIYLEVILYLPALGIGRSLGGRDGAPTKAGLAARAERALNNMKENLPFFLTFGLLAMIVDGVNMDRAILGAQIFVIARLVYVPVYVAGIPIARTAAYMAGAIGLLIMLIAVLGATPA